MQPEQQHSIEQELKQPLPRRSRIQQSYALRQMVRITCFTVLSSLLWTGLDVLSSQQPTAYPGVGGSQRPGFVDQFLHYNHDWVSLVTTVLITCAALIWMMVFIETSRRSRLVVSGAAARATVVGKRLSPGRDGAITQLRYRFVSPQGDIVEGCSDCAWREWKSAASGEYATVLFDPNNPENSVLYRLCGFKAV